jgi:hypothetical protein
MSSAQRPFFEVPSIRTAVQVIPTYLSTVNSSNYYGITLSSVTYFSLDLKKAGTKDSFTSDVYFVDLFDVDNRGIPMYDNVGHFIPASNGSNSSTLFGLMGFQVNTAFSASKAPGSEFTIFFRNVFPINSGLLTIGLLGSNVYIDSNYSSVPYLYCPPFPTLQESSDTGDSAAVSPSLTFKSDGHKYNVVSSGPAGWIGLGNYLLLTTVAVNFI